MAIRKLALWKSVLRTLQLFHRPRPSSVYDKFTVSSLDRNSSKKSRRSSNRPHPLTFSVDSTMQAMTRILRCQSCIRINRKSALIASLRVQGVQYRGYADAPQKGKKFELPDEYTEEVFHSLANNPPVMQAMHDVIEAFNSRGITLDREPSVTEMWKIMKDKQAMEALNNLSKVTKSSGIKLDHIVKAIPWSKETEKWAKSDTTDPSYSREAIQERIKTIRNLLKRPDPDNSSTLNPRPTDAAPVFEDDVEGRVMTEDEHLSLGDIQSDLRGWWKGREEAEFYERLAKFKAKAGGDLIDSEEYDFWIEEWSKKAKDISQM